MKMSNIASNASYLNVGDRRGACAEIKRWVHDGGKDCNIRSNNCYGQIERRAQ